ncbi:proclotting enzyme-like isoform X2 [Limulus polyphemus]|uniref:Proclotting enzyme-like isoform X2 n=1 Tax=Limulus polyphemus TaxID=6850 RepID=A0ABM1B8B1_LIMPO|nr:proclotting enzyme-like isoform X2 [Limulus polyphemus]
MGRMSIRLILVLVAFVYANASNNRVCGEKKIPDSFINEFKEARGAIIQNWPWTAALFTRVKDNPSRYICGATLITSRHLLTAAVCVDRGTPTNFTVLLGQDNIKLHGSKRQELAVESFKIHEHHKHGSFENDLAILKLERPVEYSESISPVCLPYNLLKRNIGAKTAFVTGWGQTTLEGETSENMLVLQVPIWNQKDCQDKYERLAVTINKTMLCAGRPEGGTDACAGFSGSPLVLLEEDKFSVVGLLSFGYSCGKQIPTVYTRITEYLDWIEINQQ